MGTVRFDSGRATLRPESYSELDETAAIMLRDDCQRYEISGYTDCTERDEDNIWLSLLRANAVRDYLIKKGIDPGRLVCKGYGPLRPAADTCTEEGRRQNRRTEIMIL